METTTIEFLSEEEIAALKEQWSQSLSSKKAQVEHLNKEILALDGAMQAADAFINIIKTKKETLQLEEKVSNGR